MHFANELEQETLGSYDKDDELQVVRIENVIKNTGKRYTALRWTVSGKKLPPPLFSEQKRLTEPQEKREAMSSQKDRAIVYQSVLKAIAGPLIRDGKSAKEVASAVHFLVDDCIRYSSSQT